jgi:hypothetical protein
MLKLRFLVVLLFLPFVLVSCGDKFVGSVPGYIEPVDMRIVDSGTNFVFVFSSNENVKVYNFEKLVSSFDRRAEFVVTKSRKLEIYQKVDGIFTSKNLKSYGLVASRGAQWLSVVNGNEFGLYNYVKGISFSEDGSRYGFVYNVGGLVSNGTIFGGKYYVNIDGYDNGPYDDALLPIFTDDGKVILVIKELGLWKVKYDTFEYGDYEDVLVPSNPVYGDKVIFLFKKKSRWYMNNTTNVFKDVVVFEFNNGNYVLGESNDNKVAVKVGVIGGGFKVLGTYDKVIKAIVNEDGTYAVVCEDSGKEILIVNDNSFSNYQDIDKIEFSENNKYWGIRYKKDGKYFVNVNGKDLWNCNLLDFAFKNDSVLIMYLEKDKILAKEIPFKNL